MRGALPLVLVFLLVAGPLVAGEESTSLAEAPCPGHTFVPGQGPSCPAGDGMWWVLLDDGARLLTHGPDPAPRDTENETGPMETLETSEPVCATPGSHRQVLIYTVPAEKPVRYDEMTEPIRNMVRQANQMLRTESAEFGEVRDYRVECTETGAPLVYAAILATPRDMTTFQTITSELRARGFTDALANYWIWHDDRIAGLGGQGSHPPSDSPFITNEAARGPHYAITYGYHSWSIMMHENGHNVGSVQKTAPQSTGGGHCIDGRDIMCYNDSGHRSHLYSSRVCTDRTHFDCNHDDYFHPRPPAGNYLHDHWNLGSHLNLFFEVPDRCTVRPGVTFEPDDLPGLPGLGAVNEHWIEDLQASCGGRYYSFLHMDAPFLQNDLDVCWYDGTTLLRCDDTPDDTARGTVPLGATRARVTYDGPSGSVFALNVN